MYEFAGKKVVSSIFDLNLNLAPQISHCFSGNQNPISGMGAPQLAATS
jgi:hypothetical protein